MARQRSKPRGFTLLELVVVMVIISVALATIAPSFRGFAAGRSHDDAAVNVLAVTEYARTQAIADAQVYRLVIDQQSNRYELLAQEQNAFVPLGKEIGGPHDLPKDMRISLTRADGANAEYIDFYPSGRTDPAIIEVTAADSAVIRVVCDSPTETFRIVTGKEATLR